MAARRPAEAFPPGEILREELEARGWTQTDLAEILGRPFVLVNEIIAGKRSITPETAKGLAAALGTSPEFWLNLEAAYQLWRVGETDSSPVERRAKLYSLAPIKDMVKRGWLEPSASVDVLEDQVKRFFDIPNLDTRPQLLAAARKSTDYDEEFTPAQLAWLFRARQLARAVQAAPFSPSALKQAIERLRLLTHQPQEVRHVPRILAEAGVRFLIIQPLPGSKMDGACFWLDARTPVVALSLRLDRIDNFWFVLMHELAHVVKGDASVDPEVAGSGDDELRPNEREANRFASETLIPSPKIESFIARNGPAYNQTKILGFAMTNHVHPAIVVGQLQHRGEVGWGAFKKVFVPIRSVVTATAVTDGWGGVLPAGA
jgi:HTH-type transcriptional regulator / antitoxin HigA